MENGTAYRNARLDFLDTNRPLPALAEMAIVVAVTVTKWRTRKHTRTALENLPPYMLKDIGITKTDADREIEKPFWRG